MNIPFLEMSDTMRKRSVDFKNATQNQLTIKIKYTHVQKI